MSRVAVFDSLRGISILVVAFMHFGTAFLDINSIYANIDSDNVFRSIQLQGFKGVFIFFALSGYLTWYKLSGFFLDFNVDRYFSYFKGRLYRILPPYYVALSGFLFVHFYLDYYQPSLLLESYVASLFLIHNSFFGEGSFILPVAWSLEIEMQYYFVVPLIVLYLSRLSLEVKFIVIGIISILFSIINLFDFKNLFDYISFFMSGVLAAEVVKSRFYNDKGGVFFDFVFILGFILLFVFDSNLNRFFSVFLIIVSAPKIKVIYKFITAKWLVYIGQTSYSNYLLHYPFYFLCLKLFSNDMNYTGSYFFDFMIQFSLIFFLSLTVIHVFYHFFERPFSNKIGFNNNIKLSFLRVSAYFGFSKLP